MPELPEAETIVRGLRRHLAGRKVAAIEILRPDLLDTPSEAFRSFLAGASFRKLARRGKNLLLHMGAARSGRRASGPDTDGRDEGFTLVINLGMSGRLLIREPGDPTPPPSHPGVRLHLDGGGELVYHDIRRFGRLAIMDPIALRAWSRTLGPEPLGPAFTVKKLRGALARSSAPIRSWLLDQRSVAGVGNIYANEALFLARVHPVTPANAMDGEGATRLYRTLRSVLRTAIRARGTTLRDYRTAEGLEGSYASRLRVYGREGSPCPRCRASILRITFGGRSAFFCPSCQRPAPSAQ
ncbi:MAG: bifunctional DNA-formamidopyrimidine glycosylase/DNA-(apurinic or apyrimidinic site) lyase, partial [Gemmatimonadetes bacterium]|nr:bifunctional DNA-formamidopyrimidine glycosylase/DNA-(apurinic or apyrimidinic site) lyase [Gemmatimonadota bacterium]